MEVNRSDSHKYGSLSLSLSPGINLDEDKQETARESKQIGKCDSDMYLVPVEMRQEKEGEQANRASDMYMPMEIEHRGQDERRSKPLSAFGSDEGQHQQEKKQRPQPPPLPSEPPPGDHNPAHQKHEQQQLQKEPSDSQLYVPMDNGEEVAEPEVYYGNQPQSRQSTESRAGFFVGDESKKADDEEGEIYANEDEGEEYVEVSETPSAGRRPPEGAAADDVEEANIYDDTGDDNLYENPEK
nr:hypothetical protein BaRGS_004172 [Batillaria attramentaria]